MIREPDSVRESARNETCRVRLPGICNFDKETTIYAHLNGVRFGKGIGNKSNLGAYCCSSCHAVVDSLSSSRGVKGSKGMSADYVLASFHEAVLETIQVMLEKGILVYGKKKD
jgi:hypothetical protein